MPWNPKPYIAIADAIALLFKPQVEVVLHDLAEDRIVHIAGAFSRRRAGDASLNDIEDIRALPGAIVGPYAKSNFDGRELKSISVVLRDARDKPAGLLCINLDVSALEAARAALDRLMLVAAAPRERPAALFAADWREKINDEIAAFLSARSASLAALSQDDVVALVGGLDSQGLFAVRNAADHIAAALGISRATLYKRLATARQKPRTRKS
jgi:predicted transcriptional regulator YheO